jgi:hypothetical protein
MALVDRDNFGNLCRCNNNRFGGHKLQLKHYRIKGASGKKLFQLLLIFCRNKKHDLDKTYIFECTICTTHKQDKKLYICEIV